jgi:hypothetical protein
MGGLLARAVLKALLTCPSACPVERNGAGQQRNQAGALRNKLGAPQERK